MKVEDILKIAIPLGVTAVVFFMLKPVPPSPPSEGVQVTEIEVG